DEEGLPVLIDFQIALGCQSRGWSLRRVLQPLIRYFQGVDRYHLQKIHRRFRPFDFSGEELAKARRKGIVIHLHGFIRRPYRMARRFVLDRFLTVNDAEAIETPRKAA